MAPMVAKKKKRHYKTVVAINKETNNGEFAEPLLPMRLKKIALGV